MAPTTKTSLESQLTDLIALATKQVADQKRTTKEIASLLRKLTAAKASQRGTTRATLTELLSTFPHDGKSLTIMQVEQQCAKQGIVFSLGIQRDIRDLVRLGLLVKSDWGKGYRRPDSQGQ